MSLNYKLDKIKDFKAVCYTPDGEFFKMNPVTEVLIWQTMPVGLGSITEGNYEEFFARLAILAKVHGDPLNTQDGTRQITLAEVKAHIGLTTNASKLTDIQFGKNMYWQLRDDANRQLDRAARAIAQAVPA